MTCGGVSYTGLSVDIAISVGVAMTFTLPTDEVSADDDDLKTWAPLCA